MATIRLVPSTYAVSSTSYLSVSSASNMYTNVDSTTYATITNTYASTSSRYLYLRGFNFDDIPDGAEVTSFTVKIRGYETSLATSTSYAPRLANGTSAIANTTASTNFGTSATTITIPTGALTWQQIANYGSDFTIMVYVRRSNRNTTGYFYCYGAEIDVTYTLPDPRTVTSTLSGNGTINPSGATTTYDGEEYELTITPTTKTDPVTVKNNGVDVTEDLVPHYSGGTSSSYSTASGSGVTTGFARSNSQFYRGNSSTTGDNWLRYAIGKTAESPYSTSNTDITYCKDGTNDATTQGWMNYPFDFSSLPADAEVTAVEVKCYGATESTTETARHADVSLWCGNEQKGTTQQFSSTSNTTMTINDPGEWTREELQDAWVRFGVGYYGGRILGITWKVTYTSGGTLSYYTYNYEVNGNATIAVTIGSSSNVPVTGVSLPSTATVEVGSSITLTPTISPSNATNQNVTWSSGNTARATVNNGVVTGVSAGTVVITVTTVDGSKTASCTVTVAAAVTYDYKLATSMVVGKKYLIANGNSGSVYLLTNESGGSRQLVGAAATVSNNKISITAATKAKAEFECVRYTNGNDATITVKSDNKYLYTDSGTGLRMNASTTLDRFWHYQNNKFWQFKSTTSNGYTDTSSEYKYYLELNSSNNFTDNHITSPSVEDTTLPAIYIFVEDDGSASEVAYIKLNGSWVQASAVYKKINGSWQEVDPSQAFEQNVNYRYSS